MDELNRSQDNNIHTLIVPMGKMACDSGGGECTDAEYRTERHEYRLRKQVVSTKAYYVPLLPHSHELVSRLRKMMYVWMYMCNLQ